MIRGSERLKIGSTKLSLLYSRGNEDFEGPLEVSSLQGRLRPGIEVILIVKVEQSGMNFK